jgi:hypothetical protein
MNNAIHFSSAFIIFTLVSVFALGSVFSLGSIFCRVVSQNVPMFPLIVSDVRVLVLVIG